MSATAVKPKTTRKAAEVKAANGKITIPAKCKPSKVVSTDGTRPIIQHAFLRRRDDEYWLLATDSYVAVAINVRGEGQLIDGFIPVGALRLMERGQDAEQISATAWKVSTPDGQVTFDIEDRVRGAREFPNFDQYGLWEKPQVDDKALSQRAKGDPFAVGINPDLMKKIADGLGANGYGCRFEIAAPLKPIRVTPLQATGDRVGLQMPIRLTV